MRSRTASTPQLSASFASHSSWVTAINAPAPLLPRSPRRHQRPHEPVARLQRPLRRVGCVLLSPKLPDAGVSSLLRTVLPSAGIGAVLGPTLGGMLARPCSAEGLLGPDSTSCCETCLLARFPYALACVTGAAFLAVSGAPPHGSEGLAQRPVALCRRQGRRGGPLTSGRELLFCPAGGLAILTEETMPNPEHRIRFPWRLLRRFRRVRSSGIFR